MATPLGSLLPWVDRRFTDQYGNPVPGARLFSYTAGLVTPQPLYADAQLTVALSNPAILDSESRLTAFMNVGGYDLVLKSALPADVELWSVEGVKDPGTSYFANLGPIWASGSKNVVSGYTVIDTDYLVTIASTGGPNPCVINLRAAAAQRTPLWLKNLGTVDCAITPPGVDTIDGLDAAFPLLAADPPYYPTLMLVSDGVSSYYVVAGF